MPWERLVWLAPLAIAAAGAYRPRWALFLFAACLPLFGSPPGGPYLAAFDLAAVAVVLISLRAPRPATSSLTWPVLALLFVGFASLIPIAYHPPSWYPASLLRLASTLPEAESWSALYTWRAALDLALGVALFHAACRLLRFSSVPAPAPESEPDETTTRAGFPASVRDWARGRVPGWARVPSWSRMPGWARVRFRAWARPRARDGAGDREDRPAEIPGASTGGLPAVTALGTAVALALAAIGLLGLLEHLEILDLDSYRAIGELVPVERMHSLFFNSGWLAEYVIVAAPFAVACLLARRWRVAAVLLTALCLVVVVLTQQRGAWLSCLAQAGMLAFAYRRRLADSRRLRRQLALGVAGFTLLLVGVLLLSPLDRSQALRQRLTGSLTDLAGRETLWTASLELTGARPLLGWGVGSFAPAYDALYAPGSAAAHRPRGTAHNWYLNALAETGMLGLAALALVAVTATVILRRAYRGGEPRQRLLALGLTLSLAGALVYGVVQYMPFMRSIHWLLWMLLAAVTATSSERQPRGWATHSAQVLGLIALLWLPFRLSEPTPRWRGDRAYGLREPEASGERRFQWTGARAAIRVPWTSACLRVPVANGHPAAKSHPVEVRIRAAGATRRVRPGGSWQLALLEVGPPRADSLLVELTAKPTFRPFLDFPRQGLPRSRDVRRLGAAVGTVDSVPCPDGGPVGRP